ncbi:hypothetical protein IMZ48_40200 [Candidatus Bathyarchaeota archaeon]|nr:hypothetical protein [Candidatus Bathyarchaeota archaeon]
MLTPPDDEDDGYGDEDEYGDEMDYDEEGLSSHGDDNVSDEDEEIGEMGPIEGLDGDRVLEVIVGDDDDDMDEDEDEDETSAESDDGDDDMGSDEFGDEEDRVEIAVEENDLMEDDGNPEWESATDSIDEDGEALGFDAEGPGMDDDMHHHHHHHHHGLSDNEILGNITRAVIGGETDFDPDDVDDLGETYMDDGREDDGRFPPFFPPAPSVSFLSDKSTKQRTKRMRTSTMTSIPTTRTILVSRSRQPSPGLLTLRGCSLTFNTDPVPAMMPPGLGWDTLMVDPPQLPTNAHANRRHRQRGNAFGQGWTLAPTPRDFTGMAGPPQALVTL